MFCLHLLPPSKSQCWLGSQQSTQQIVIKEAHKHGPALHSGYQQTQQFSPAAVTSPRQRVWPLLRGVITTESRNVDGKIKIGPQPVRGRNHFSNLIAKLPTFKSFHLFYDHLNVVSAHRALPLRTENHPSDNFPFAFK